MKKEATGRAAGSIEHGFGTGSIQVNRPKRLKGYRYPCCTDSSLCGMFGISAECCDLCRGCEPVPKVIV